MQQTKVQQISELQQPDMQQMLAVLLNGPYGVKLLIMSTV